MFTVRNQIIFRVWLIIMMTMAVMHLYSRLRTRKDESTSYAQPNQRSGGARLMGGGDLEPQDQDPEVGIHWDPMHNW